MAPLCENAGGTVAAHPSYSLAQLSATAGATGSPESGKSHGLELGGIGNSGHLVCPRPGRNPSLSISTLIHSNMNALAKSGHCESL